LILSTPLNPLSTLINSAGGLQIKDWFFPDWKAGGHGLTDIRKALAWSVNTYFYYLGGGYNDFTGLGVRRITDYAHLFGLGQPLGIDLPGEEEGLLPNEEWKEKTKNEAWYILDCKPNSKLICGLNDNFSLEKIFEFFTKSDEKLLDCLNYININKGDFIFIPAGTVHALCKGILVAEIQQSSDVTYRLFDY